MTEDLSNLKSKIDKHGESITLFKWIMGLHVIVFVAAIPWGINVQTNLAVLAANVQKIDTSPPSWLIDRLVKVEEKLDKITTTAYGSSK